MDPTILSNPWVMVTIVLWTIPWKGVALWKSARQTDKAWFVALLLINTVGLLKILYIFLFSKKKQTLQA